MDEGYEIRRYGGGDKGGDVRNGGEEHGKKTLLYI